jgi:hypothetical protein
LKRRQENELRNATVNSINKSNELLNKYLSIPSGGNSGNGGHNNSSPNNERFSLKLSLDPEVAESSKQNAKRTTAEDSHNNNNNNSTVSTITKSQVMELLRNGEVDTGDNQIVFVRTKLRSSTLSNHSGNNTG